MNAKSKANISASSIPSAFIRLAITAACSARASALQCIPQSRSTSTSRVFRSNIGRYQKALRPTSTSPMVSGPWTYGTPSSILSPPMPVIVNGPEPSDIKRLSDEGRACPRNESHACAVFLIRCRPHGQRTTRDGWNPRTQSLPATS